MTPSAHNWFEDCQNLTDIHSECWLRLSESIQDRNSGWRLPVLATETDNGLRQRILVLRHVDTEQQKLFAHTDLRSAKVAQIQRQPNVTWLFYDQSQQVQLHVHSMVSIHTNDDIADRFWASEPTSSLRCYLGHQAPGTVCRQPEHNLPDCVRGRIPDRSEVQPGRTNFAVIVAQVTEIEWLKLNQQGNLRARFFPFDNHPSEWLAP